MAKMKLYTHEEMLDRVLGPKGSPERDNYEAEMNSFLVGEAIKNARLKQNLTQEELGERIGVKRSQICKLENGKSSITLSTMAKVFKALGIPTATLDLGIAGKVSLW